jgi:uncharacterized protein YndB with AHSA1/START domain
MTTTVMARHIRASRAAVYRALTDARAVQQWRVPPGMTSEVHVFEAREGGAIRVSLTYESADRTGKSGPHTDTYRGRFVRLVPDREVVEIDEFETVDPDLRGEMTITITLHAADGGTDLVAAHDGLPRGIAPADNELGWRLALDRLAHLVEEA